MNAEWRLKRSKPMQVDAVRAVTILASGVNRTGIDELIETFRSEGSAEKSKRVNEIRRSTVVGRHVQRHPSCSPPGRRLPYPLGPDKRTRADRQREATVGAKLVKLREQCAGWPPSFLPSKDDCLKRKPRGPIQTRRTLLSLYNSGALVRPR